MALGCGMKCLKFLLFAFNFVFWVCGIAMMGIGIYSRIKAKDWDSLLGDDGSVASSSNIMIAAGAFVVLVGFLGCCGAWKQNKFMLIAYAILLIFIFILEIAAGIYAYTKKGDVIGIVRKHLNTSIKTSYGGSHVSDKPLTESVDWVQENVKCCGVDKYEDWSKTNWYIGIKEKINDTTAERELVPKSCCKDMKKAKCNTGTGEAGQINNLEDNLHTEGCVKASEDYIKDHILEIGGVGVGIAFVQIFGIVVSLLLCRAIGYEKI